MIAYPKPLVNTSNNSLTSPILILSVTLNFISQILEMFRLNHNHKHNSFKTTDFRLYFSILLLPNIVSHIQSNAISICILTPLSTRSTPAPSPLTQTTSSSRENPAITKTTSSASASVANFLCTARSSQHPQKISYLPYPQSSYKVS